MPPSFYCKPRWIKAGGRSTGHSLAPSTQIQFMNNQSKKCLSEQHCPIRALFYIYLEYMEELLFDEYAEGLKNVLLVY